MSKNVVLFNDITNALKRGTLALKMVETKVKQSSIISAVGCYIHLISMECSR